MPASVSSESYVRGVGDGVGLAVCLAVTVGLGVVLSVGLAVGLGFDVWASAGVSVDGFMRGVEVGPIPGLSDGSSASALGLGVSFISTVGPNIGAVVRLLTVDEQPAKRQTRSKRAHNLCFTCYSPPLEIVV